MRPKARIATNLRLTPFERACAKALADQDDRTVSYVVGEAVVIRLLAENEAVYGELKRQFETQDEDPNTAED